MGFFKPSNYLNLMEGGNRQSKANEGERLFVKGSHLVFFTIYHLAEVFLIIEVGQIFFLVKIC